MAYNLKKPKKGTQIKCDDERKLYVAVGCGNCYECRRQKAQQWRVRLCEEMKIQKFAYFVTLTFSNEALITLSKENNDNGANETAVFAVRRFLERYRKQYKKSLRHWFITELGHENTERIHIHGIIFPPQEMTNDELSKFWKYGRTDIGEYCNVQTINYIVKYVTKIDTDHKKFKPQIMCSAGLGENFVHTIAAQNTYKYKPKRSAEFYTLNNGQKVALPIYYRNKLYTQEERDKMWTDRLDKNEIYVNGMRVRNINTEEGYRNYMNILRTQQEWNESVGYGSTAEEWKAEKYKITLDMLQKARAIR